MKITRRRFLELGSLLSLQLLMDSCSASSKLSNIALVSIDTLRADYFSPEFMPKTYEWARNNCQIFENVYANATWTLPSHVTMLTGLSPEEHGVESIDIKIPGDTPMVQERLGKLGYHTFGFTDGGLVGRKFGFSRGFEDYTPHESKTAKQPLSLANLFRCNSLEKIATEIANLKGPKFLFIHTYKVHHYLAFANVALRNLADREGLPNQKRRELYTKNLRKFDSKFAEFVGKATKKTTKMIITSDHGEGFGEEYKDNVGHAGKPYKEKIRVPLIVHGNGTASFKHLTDLTRIRATLESFAGLPRTNTIYKKSDAVTSTHVFQRKRRYSAKITRNSYSFNVEPYVPKKKEKIDFEKNPRLQRKLEALGYL